MATEAQVQRERKSALRGVRREERAMDSKLEVVERELFRLLRKKRMIDLEDVDRLIRLYSEFQVGESKLQGAMTAFVKVVS